MVAQKILLKSLLKWRLWTIPSGISLLLMILAQYSFLTFYTLIEFFTVIISFIIFTLAWSTKEYIKNNFLIFLACGYLWIGTLDLLHILSHEGMNNAAQENVNLSIQFWTVARYLEALMLFVAPFAAAKKQSGYLLITFFGLLAATFAILIFSGQLPTNIIESQNVTTLSEYVIDLILALALLSLFYNNHGISAQDKTFVMAAITLTLCAQLMFTFTADRYVFINLLANVVRFFSYWLIFNVIIGSNFKKPYAALRKNKEDFKRLFDNSEASIWHVDFSSIIEALNDLRVKGISDLDQHLKMNKRLALKLVAMIKVRQVNEATLTLFAANNHEDFFARNHAIFKVESIDTFIKGIVAIWDNKKSFSSESVYRTLDGLEINCMFSFQIPKVESDFKSIPVTFVDITRRKQNEARIWRQGHFDNLTGLVNRNLFSDRLDYMLERGKRNTTRVALLYLDLDGFKHINDTLGHLVGDKLLQGASQRLIKQMRKSDTVARLGGDEFAVLLPEVTRNYDIEATVSKIQLSLAQPYHLQGHDYFVSASIGITIFPDDGEDSVTLLRKADSAMYKAKEKGRNNFQFFTQEIDKEAMRRKELEEALHIALNDDSFYLNYQPVISLDTGIIESAEALIRWNHPEKGMISPSEFIPLAEEIGLIVPIGEWVLREACKAAMTWPTLGKEPLAVAVNFSSRQFQSRNIPGFIKSVLQSTGLPAQRLILEITESLFLADNNAILNQLVEIRSLGVRFSIDDFGTGYSSLSYLKKFPVSMLKIDQSFIKNLPTASEDVALVNAILSMAHSLGMKVVAEGVETTSQADFIKSTNCQYLQGFLYSKPLAQAEFIDYLGEYENNELLLKQA